MKSNLTYKCNQREREKEEKKAFSFSTTAIIWASIALFLVEIDDKMLNQPISEALCTNAWVKETKAVLKVLRNRLLLCVYLATTLKCM